MALLSVLSFPDMLTLLGLEELSSQPQPNLICFSLSLRQILLFCVSVASTHAFLMRKIRRELL